MSLKDFLKDKLSLGRDDVFKVDTKDSFSFFNTEASHTDSILEFFSDYKENGRFINVEVSKSPEGGGGRGGRNKGRRRERRRSIGGSSRGGSRRKERGFSKGKAAHSGKRRKNSKKKSGFY